MYSERDLEESQVNNNQRKKLSDLVQKLLRGRLSQRLMMYVVAFHREGFLLLCLS